MLEPAPLEAVYIFFDTTTYDEIERDEKVTVHRAGKRDKAIDCMWGVNSLGNKVILFLAQKQ